jgi:hypothetical protein
VVETIRQRTLQVEARLEKEAIASRPLPSTAAPSITLSIGGGHVRSVRSYQMRSFEILLAQASNHDGRQVAFSSVPAEAERQREQLRRVLQGLRATPSTPVTILSDGAADPRSFGEAASLGPTQHVLDWFHLVMRIQHAARRPKAGLTLLPPTAWQALHLPTRSSGSVGICGMVRSSGLWISSTKRLGHSRPVRSSVADYGVRLEGCAAPA